MSTAGFVVLVYSDGKQTHAYATNQRQRLGEFIAEVCDYMEEGKRCSIEVHRAPVEAE